MATIKRDDIAPIAGPALVANIVTQDRIVAAELLETDAKQSSIQTREKSLRERDRSFAGLLLVEGLDEASLAASVARLRFPESAPGNKAETQGVRRVVETAPGAVGCALNTQGGCPPNVLRTYSGVGASIRGVLPT